MRQRAWAQIQRLDRWQVQWGSEPEVEDHVSPEAENIPLALENPGAKDVPEVATSDTVRQLLENADGTGTTGSRVQRITRSGRQSRMRQCPYFFKEKP